MCAVQVGTAPDGRPIYDCGGGNPEAIVIDSTDQGSGLLYAFAVSKDWTGILLSVP